MRLSKKLLHHIAKMRALSKRKPAPKPFHFPEFRYDLITHTFE